MIENSQKGLKATHKLVIEARLLCLRNNSKLSAKLLDDIEYLIALMLKVDNQDAFFDEILKSVCEEFGFEMIYKEV